MHSFWQGFFIRLDPHLGRVRPRSTPPAGSSSSVSIPGLEPPPISFGRGPGVQGFARHVRKLTRPGPLARVLEHFETQAGDRERSLLLRYLPPSLDAVHQVVLRSYHASADEDFRVQALDVLSRSPSPASFELLRSVAMADGRERLRRMAILALSRASHPTSTPLLLALERRDLDKGLHAEVVCGLGKRRTPEAARRLIEVSQRTSPERKDSRLAAIRYLSNHRDTLTDERLQALRTCLLDEDEAIRIAAVRSLSHFDAAWIAGELSTLSVGDPSVRVREEAGRVLR